MTNFIVTEKEVCTQPYHFESSVNCIEWWKTSAINVCLDVSCVLFSYSKKKSPNLAGISHHYQLIVESSTAVTAVVPSIDARIREQLSSFFSPVKHSSRMYWLNVVGTVNK